MTGVAMAMVAFCFSFAALAVILVPGLGWWGVLWAWLGGNILACLFNFALQIGDDPLEGRDPN